MIVLSGKKRSGKDTAASVFVQHGFKTYALAAPIKESLFYAFEHSDQHIPFKVTMDMLNGVDNYDREQPLGLNRNQVIDVLIEAYFYTMREHPKPDHYSLTENARYLRTGIFDYLDGITEPEKFSIRKFMQVFGTDIICSLVSNRHWLDTAEHRAPKDAIITDIRQPWEEEYFRERGATFVFVIGAYPDYVEPTDTHITEQGLVPRDNDVIITNNTIDNLHKEIQCLLKNLTN